jgi:zinc transport system substrate-binding protein
MRIPALLLLLPTLLTACGRDDLPVEAGAGPNIVATLYPLASVARAVAGPHVSVHTLLPPGAHPDTYEATPRDAEAIAAADLLVRVGGAADAWVGSPAGVPAVVFTDGMGLVAESERDRAHHGDTGNPHVWLDPIHVRDVLLPRLTDALVRLEPDSASAIRERASAYADSLTALDAEIRALLADAPSRRFVSAHPAWVYFAERYDLVPSGVVHVAPGQEIATRALARLVDEARARQVSAVIAEPQLGRGGVDALAGELRARVEVADPVGGASIPGRDDYLSLMRFNARAFARALGAGT